MAFKSNALTHMQGAFFMLVMCSAVVTAQSDGFLENGLQNLETADTLEDTCGNQQFTVLKGRLLENYDSVEELYKLPTFAAASSLPKYTRSNDSYYIHGSRLECASLQVRVNSQGGITCPGRYVINRDVNRVPCVMKEFKCLCRQCLLPHSLQSRRTTSGCEPIHQYVPVMRRTVRLDVEGDVWSYVLEPVSVGCTCASRRHVHSARS